MSEQTEQVKRNPNLSCQHWNGNQICAIDIETTGLDPNYHEIIQLCILPLTASLEPRRDVLPFNIYIRPDRPERADRAAMEVSKIELAHIYNVGFDKEKAKDVFDEWYKRLNLSWNKYRTRQCRVIPLGHNITQFDIPFLKNWLGRLNYENYFFHHARDTMLIASYLNDKAAFHVEQVPFSKIDLSYCLSSIGLKRDRAHDALQDCLAVVDLYKWMVQRGFF